MNHTTDDPDSFSQQDNDFNHIKKMSKLVLLNDI